MSLAWEVHYTFSQEEKRNFAVQLLKNPKEPLVAAISAFGSGPEQLGRNLWAAQNLDQDPEVVAFRQQIVESENAQDLIPSKAQAALKAWQWANRFDIPTKEGLEALKLFCEIEGYVKSKEDNDNTKTLIPPVIKFMIDDDNGTSGSSSQTESATA